MFIKIHFKFIFIYDHFYSLFHTSFYIHSSFNIAQSFRFMSCLFVFRVHVCFHFMFVFISCLFSFHVLFSFNDSSTGS